MSEGYQPKAKIPGQGNLDTSRPPQSGSGIIGPTMKNKDFEPGNFICIQDGKIVPEGLSRREYFAGLAMQGILSNASGIEEPAHWVRYAVKYADALLKELSKGDE